MSCTSPRSTLRPALHAALFVAMTAAGAAPGVRSAPLLSCPEGPDPLRFRAETAVADVADGGARSVVALAAALDPVSGREWIALAFEAADGAGGGIAVAVSADGGCSFDAPGRPPVAVPGAEAGTAPALALRAEDGDVRLVVLWQDGGGVHSALASPPDAPFEDAVELTGDAVSPPSACFAPAPATGLVAAWVAGGAGAHRLDVARNDAGGAGAGWTIDADVAAGLAGDLGADAELALACDGAGESGAGGVSLGVATTPAVGLHLARSADAGASWGAWRRIDDGTLERPTRPALGAGGLDATATPTAWSLGAWSGMDAGAGEWPVKADALRHAGAAVDFDLDSAAIGASPTMGLPSAIDARLAVAVADGPQAFVAWEQDGELAVSRRPLDAERPQLDGGCGPSVVTGIDPPRSLGSATDPVAAALGGDVVLAFVDSRSGSPAAWLKRADSSAPAPPGTSASVADCPQPPAITIDWSQPACDVAWQRVELGTVTGGTDRSIDAPPASGAASVTFEGLEPATTYFVRVVAADGAGNEAVSEEITLVTPSCSGAHLEATLTGLVDECPFGGAGGDGEPDPGERLQLTWTVENVGTEAASDVRFRALSRSPHVTVLDAEIALGDLAPGAVASASAAVDLSASAACGSSEDLLARVRVDGAAWSDLFALGVPVGCAACTTGACSVTADASATAPTTTCAGDAVTLDATASTASDCAGVLLHEWWEDGDLIATGTAATRSPTTSRTYRLVSRCSTDLACTSESSIDVTVNPLPGISFSTSPQPPHCEGEAVTLTASTSDPAATFAWDGGETGATIDVTASGVFRVSVTDSNGCVRARRTRVEIEPLPVADAGDDLQACGPTPIGTPGFPTLDYSWEPATGLSDPRAAQPEASPPAVTTYVLTVTDPLNGCTATDSVTVEPLPTPSVVADLRVAPEAGSDALAFRWGADPNASATRVYSETDVAAAAEASADSPTARLECEGGASCSAPTPAGALVFFQAVGVCADGIGEGPNR